jgi:hypothetical protein
VWFLCGGRALGREDGRDCTSLVEVIGDESTIDFEIHPQIDRPSEARMSTFSGCGTAARQARSSQP